LSKNYNKILSSDTFLQISRRFHGNEFSFFAHGRKKNHSDFMPNPLLFRPSVVVPVQHVTGTLGRTVGLKCEVDAYPRADIVWTKRGEYDEIETSGR
jgi:hypothetical protein